MPSGSVHQAGLVSWRDGLLAGGLGNPFVHLRRGQTLYELGDHAEAANELLRALLLGGAELFANEDEAYWAFITARARPPVGRTSWDDWPGLEEGAPGFEWLWDPAAYGFRRRP